MKFCFIWPGKTRNPHIKALIDDYQARISKYIKSEIIETQAGKMPFKANDEEKKIVARTPSSSYIILLDIKGKMLDSEKLAAKIEQLFSSGKDCVVFIIGGEQGSTKWLQEKSDMLLSLTQLTVTHEMARLLLLEQVYRGLTIINKHPYHK
jgi:23S rRNA (pseudouridine1915-N3)-methyltransferase